MTGEEIHIAVSTNKGAYILTADTEKNMWKKTGPFLKDENVNDLTSDRNGRLYASTLSNGVFISDDRGRTWKNSNRGLHIRKVWTVEADPKEDGLVYAGTHYGHLFKSSDSGESWKEVTGLHNAPLRNEWGIDWDYGTIGLAIHTVMVDPEVKGKVYIISSGGGPYLTNDGGETWELLRTGVNLSCPKAKDDLGWEAASEEERIKEHLENVHKCSHKLAISRTIQGTLFQQNHCGIFASTDSGSHWEDISISPEIRHGFATTLLENGKNSLFVVPAYQEKCQKHNSCILGPLEVYRSDNSGKSWVNASNGLPKETHTGVLRDSMTHDFGINPGVYFGTTTGDVFASADQGNSWQRIADGLNRVQGVSAVSF